MNGHIEKKETLSVSFQRTLVCAISVIVALTSVAIVFHHLRILKNTLSILKYLLPIINTQAEFPFIMKHSVKFGQNLL